MSSSMSSTPSRLRPTGSPSRRYFFFLAAGLLAGSIVTAQPGQQPKNSSASTGAPKSPRHRPQAVAPQALAPAEQLAPAPEPVQPRWPVNETPAKPSVTWDSRGLRIQANNSSLHEILNQVSADTGAKVEGIGSDERVFGEYGPGAARDVISQLLHGSNYNVLMIGDQGEGTPRQIVLSSRHAGGNSPTNANPGEEQQQPDEDFVPEEPQAEDQPVQPPQPPPIMNGRPPMQMAPQGPPGAPRTPQQVLQELQQRQQQIMDQQQQQQQQQQPH